MAMAHTKHFKRKPIQKTDPGLILSLIMSLTDDSCAEIQKKINAFIAEECDADLMFQVIVHCERKEAFMEVVGTLPLPRKMKINDEESLKTCMPCLEGKLSAAAYPKDAQRATQPLQLVHSDVCGPMQEPSWAGAKYLVTFTDDYTRKTFGYLMKEKSQLTDEFVQVLMSNRDQMVYLKDFNEDIQTLVTPHVRKDNIIKHVIMLPIVGRPFTVIFCVVGARIVEGNVPMLMRECAQFVWPTLSKAVCLEYESLLKVKCQKLLRVAKKLFTQVVTFKNLLEISMELGRRLIRADYCVIMMIDVDKKQVYDFCSARCKCNQKLLGELNICGERRFDLETGIVGEVIKTGKLLNVRKPQEHPLFNPLIDSLPDINCRNLLCFPIREQTGMIAVGIFINKIIEPNFERIDEEMALSFSIYCGSCIYHSIVYKKIQEAHIRNALTSDLTMYYIKVSDEEVSRMLACPGYHHHPHLASLCFDPRALPPRELPCYVLKMFIDLGFVKKFDINKQKLARFILCVKKAYRDVPYHNWMHAFSVAQWAYASLKTYKLVSKGYFNDLQALMYFLACLLHDIDHCGATLRFQVDGSTTLATLYTSGGSMMERHHLAQALCVINREGCDILETLPRKDYDRAIMMLRDNILATDLNNYFKHVNEYKAIAMNYQIGRQTHFNALQCVLMTAADMSDEIKDWNCVKKSTAAVLTEFYNQVEQESLLVVNQVDRGAAPISVTTDIDKCCIPELEIEHLRNVIIPLYLTLNMLIPAAETYTEVMEDHINKWLFSKPAFAEVSFHGGLSVLLSPELDTLIELNIQETERLERERLEAELAALRAAEEEESD